MELKTINEINQSFNESLESEKAEQSRGSPVIRVMSDILFYLVIIIVLYSVLVLDMEDGSSRSIMGYSCFTVMSSSMRDEIPKGSLIIVKRTEPSALKTGDNITFRSNTGTTVTHKIIGIADESTTEGERQFQTKGVNNTNPDDYTVAESDIVGKVVLVLPGAGSKIGAVSGNIHIVLLIFLGCSLLSFLLRIAAGRFKQKSRS